MQRKLERLQNDAGAIVDYNRELIVSVRKVSSKLASHVATRHMLCRRLQAAKVGACALREWSTLLKTRRRRNVLMLIAYRHKARLYKSVTLSRWRREARLQEWSRARLWAWQRTARIIRSGRDRRGYLVLYFILARRAVGWRRGILHAWRSTVESKRRMSTVYACIQTKLALKQTRMLKSILQGWDCHAAEITRVRIALCNCLRRSLVRSAFSFWCHQQAQHSWRQRQLLRFLRFERALLSWT
jgi:hypothetical protein